MATREVDSAATTEGTADSEKDATSDHAAMNAQKRALCAYIDKQVQDGVNKQKDEEANGDESPAFHITAKVAATYALDASEKANDVRRAPDREASNVEPLTAGAYAVQRPNTITHRSTGRQADLDPESGNPHPDPLVEAQLIEEGRQQTDEVIVAEEVKEQPRRFRALHVVIAVAILALLVTFIILFAVNRNQNNSNLHVSGGATENTSTSSEEVGEEELFPLSDNTTGMPIIATEEDEEEEEEEQEHCFQNTQDLYDALDAFYEDSGPNSTIAQTYGWPIGTWCVSKVSLFQHLFQATRIPNHLSEEARHTAIHFHEDLGNWDMSNAKEMEEMFGGLRNISSSLGIHRWDTSKMVSLKALFMDTTWQEPNLDLGSWNTSNVESLDQMFRWSNVGKPNIGQWDTSKVTILHRFADSASNFDEDISGWNTQSLTHLGLTFLKARAFNQDLSNWNTSSVRVMQGTFQEASSFNQDLSSWDVSQVSNMMQVFAQSGFNSDVSSWNVSLVTDLRWAFSGASNFSQDLCAWGSLLPPNVETTSMFAGTNCPNTSDPVGPEGPYCFNC